MVTVGDEGGFTKDFDFAELPVAEAMQRSLAEAFALRSAGWSSHVTAVNYWKSLVVFSHFLSQMESPPEDLDGLTAATLKRWRALHVGSNTGRKTLASVRWLLRRAPQPAAGPAAEELARRIPRQTPSKQSYEKGERDRVVLAAQRQFRSAWLRIGENTLLLNRWRAGGVAEGGREWKIGEILDHLARTGDVPRTVSPCGGVAATNRVLLGGGGAERTWGRLFLTPGELTALAVLLTDRFGWNLSLYGRMPVPTTVPSVGETSSVTYQVQVEKRRAGGGRWFSTENITDSGAGSPGRLISQALEATAHGRALAAGLKPGTDRLMVAHEYRSAPKDQDLDRPHRVGPLTLGVGYEDARQWAGSHKLGGSPFQRSRRTTVTRPLQHTQRTHESIYVLPDKQVQRASRSVFEVGALEALGQARSVVFGGQVADAPDPEHQQTATVDCEDEKTSPWPSTGGGCGADFLLCLACRNAHVHPGHHPRIAHLHQQLHSLRSVLDDRAFQDGWNDHLLRLEDLRDKVGPVAWRAALAQVSDTDRAVVQLLVKGDLVP
ncbi:hypothetical protein ACH4FX_42045 [Streptomyces sp. NPDC018019]|uniref:hypothetical protein n=1 Tax=Streptomyces sp. NPDC018019 TaxID=3365030 RepID=UPI003799C83C